MEMLLETDMGKAVSTNPFPTRNDEIIDYSIRPAKNIERKMICEALARLSILSSIRTYHYIGFGSSYFVDLIMFHKALGIQKLTSIEGNPDMEERVRFNTPYSCVDVKIGMSTDLLPEVEWDENKSILWLDYISPLTGYMFSDLTTFFTRALSGSVFIISVNAEVKDEAGLQTITERIKAKLKKDKEVESRVKKSFFAESSLKKSDYYSVIRNIVNEEITSVLAKRNRLEPDKNYSFKQIFNFIYHDGQAMLTIGGILFAKKDSAKVRNMAFDNLPFYSNDTTSFEISVPHLTNREMQALDKYLPGFHSDPKSKQEALNKLKNVVSETAIEKYAKVYQYFPSYKEVAI